MLVAPEPRDGGVGLGARRACAGGGVAVLLRRAPGLQPQRTAGVERVREAAAVAGGEDVRARRCAKARVDERCRRRRPGPARSASAVSGTAPTPATTTSTSTDAAVGQADHGAGRASRASPVTAGAAADVHPRGDVARRPRRARCGRARPGPSAGRPSSITVTAAPSAAAARGQLQPDEPAADDPDAACPGGAARAGPATSAWVRTRCTGAPSNGSGRAVAPVASSSLA